MPSVRSLAARGSLCVARCPCAGQACRERSFRVGKARRHSSQLCVITHICGVHARPFTTSNYILVTIDFRLRLPFTTAGRGTWRTEGFVHASLDLFVIALYLI